MANHNVDVVVIGSGPGGYVAAIRASQLGMKVICVEKSELGGVCLNWGCIPTKALLKNAEYAHFLNHAGDFGFNIPAYTTDMSKVVDRSRKVAGQMSKGVNFLFGKYKVQTVVGWGKIKNNSTVEVSDPNGAVTDTITAKHIIIATGARPRMMPGLEVDRVKIITSTEALIQRTTPKSMIIMGAGAIGVEFAYFFNAFGTKVTIVEFADRLLPVEDEDVSKELLRHYKSSGIEVLTSTKVLAAKPTASGAEVTVEQNGQQKTLTADLALNAIGIQANIENIGLEANGVNVERGFIKIDHLMRTNVPNIYAIGDVAGAPWLAHKASAEGIALAEFLAGHGEHGIDYNMIPGCTYCNPQVASIGLTEKKAKEAGYDVRIGKFPFTANGKAHGIGEAKGFVKLVIDNKYGEILGAHLIGPDVTEMIGEIAVAKAAGATGTTLFKTVHAHPTLGESIMEAAAQAYGEAVNI